MKMLLDAGARVNHGSRDGTSALELSVLLGRTPVTELLLKHGANPNLPVSAGTYPLLESALANDLGEVKLLVRYGANVNVSGPKGEYALLGPSMRANDASFPLVQFLIAHGVHVNAKTTSGWTPLMQAAASNNGKIAKALIEAGAKLNAKSSRGTALDVAVRSHNEAVAALLKQAGSTVHAGDTR
jgi:serine/threonine-protein phosphatase 6 regulatory ankyrin repeat subunit B